jgi:hypothetical protein
MRVLDPACGSGTFLFHAVRRFLSAADEARLPLQRALELCTDQISGIDVHPVAVLFARVTYLLAIGADRLRGRSGDLSIPVFLGDSLQWDVRGLLTEEEVEVSVPGEAPLVFPGSVAGDPATLETVLRRMRELADQNKHRNIFAEWLRDRTSLPARDQAILSESYERMRSLHEEGRNHIWTYIVRNLTRPLWLSHRRGKPNVLIGNPPWLRYNSMSADLQKRFRAASIQRGLWAGGKVATHQDLSAYFFARSIERYLPIGGKIAFVMPAATLTRRQFAGFRTGRFADRKGNLHAAVRLDEVWLFKSDVGPLFDVPSCVIFGERTPTAGSLPSSVLAFAGRLPRRDAAPEEADRNLRASEEPWPAIATDAEASPYSPLFKQGATLVPRRLVIVVPAVLGRFGGDPAAPLVESRVTTLDKPPWNRVSPLRGQIEQKFLRPIILGESIAPFRLLTVATGVIPWLSTRQALLDADAALSEDYPRLADWLRQTEKLWSANRSSSLSFLQQLDYYGKLKIQFPVRTPRVVYAASGTLPSALVLEDQHSIIEHGVYWAPARTLAEARYLAAIFNSEAARARVEAYQSEGQFGARHFDKVMLRQLPIPMFDEARELHTKLARMAEDAEGMAANVELPASKGFQAHRKRIRAVLTEAGIAPEIDRLVTELLSAD